jgi:hypothetical protein
MFLSKILIIAWSGELGDFDSLTCRPGYLAEFQFFPEQVKVYWTHQTCRLHNLLLFTYNCIIPNIWPWISHRITNLKQKLLSSTNSTGRSNINTTKLTNFNCIIHLTCPSLRYWVPFHLFYRGLSPSDCDYNLLDVARRLEMYGIILYPARVSITQQIPTPINQWYARVGPKSLWWLIFFVKFCRIKIT